MALEAAHDSAPPGRAGGGADRHASATARRACVAAWHDVHSGGRASAQPVAPPATDRSCAGVGTRARHGIPLT